MTDVRTATDDDPFIDEWENLDPADRAEVDKEVLRHEVRNFCKSARLEAERAWKVGCTYGRAISEPEE